MTMVMMVMLVMMMEFENGRAGTPIYDDDGNFGG